MASWRHGESHWNSLTLGDHPDGDVCWSLIEEIPWGKYLLKWISPIFSQTHQSKSQRWLLLDLIDAFIHSEASISMSLCCFRRPVGDQTRRCQKFLPLQMVNTLLRVRSTLLLEWMEPSTLKHPRWCRDGCHFSCRG